MLVAFLVATVKNELFHLTVTVFLIESQEVGLDCSDFVLDFGYVLILDSLLEEFHELKFVEIREIEIRIILKFFILIVVVQIVSLRHDFIRLRNLFRLWDNFVLRELNFFFIQINLNVDFYGIRQDCWPIELLNSLEFGSVHLLINV